MRTPNSQVKVTTVPGSSFLIGTFNNHSEENPDSTNAQVEIVLNSGNVLFHSAEDDGSLPLVIGLPGVEANISLRQAVLTEGTFFTLDGQTVYAGHELEVTFVSGTWVTVPAGTIVHQLYSNVSYPLPHATNLVLL